MTLALSFSGHGASSMTFRPMRLGKNSQMTGSCALSARPSNPWGNEMDIPEDVMEAAGGVLRDFMHSPKKGKLTHIIARAIMAERERCAESIEEMGALRGEQKCCGHGIGSPPECCGDPLLLISTSDAASVIRNGAKP